MGSQNGDPQIFFPIYGSGDLHSRPWSCAWSSNSVTCVAIVDFSVYLHPVTKKDELDRFIQWLMSDRLPSLPCILAGDFNKAEVSHSSEWSTLFLLSLLGLYYRALSMEVLLSPDPKEIHLLMIYSYQRNM